MSRIFWDTNLFIYLFEGTGALATRTAELRRKMLARGDQLLTSALTLGEVLVKPMEQADAELCERYERAILGTAVAVPFEIEAAKVYAALRSDRALRAPDAMQLACAAVARVDLFITNDARLQSKRVDGIQFIVALEQAPI